MGQVHSPTAGPTQRLEQGPCHSQAQPASAHVSAKACRVHGRVSLGLDAAALARPPSLLGSWDRERKQGSILLPQASYSGKQSGGQQTPCFLLLLRCGCLGAGHAPSHPPALAPPSPMPCRCSHRTLTFRTPGPGLPEFEDLT